MNTCSPPELPHIVYLSGDFDYSAPAQIIAAQPGIPLGPHCWLLRLPAGRAHQFADRLALTLPPRCAYQLAVLPITGAIASMAENCPDTVMAFLLRT